MEIVARYDRQLPGGVVRPQNQPGADVGWAVANGCQRWLPTSSFGDPMTAPAGTGHSTARGLSDCCTSRT